MSDDAGHQGADDLAGMWLAVGLVGAFGGAVLGGGTLKAAGIGAAATVGWELAWMVNRRSLRQETYKAALAHARAVGKPLVVIGAPDRGGTNDLNGDIVIDIAPSSAPHALVADITKRIPLGDDSCVVFVPYVLEYVSDLDAAVREIKRIARDRVYMLRVEPWTFTAYGYKGARRTVPEDLFPAPRAPGSFKPQVTSFKLR